MNENLLDLYNITIIDLSDITKIRSYVNNQYAFASKKDKLNLVTYEINKLMDKYLDGLCYSLKTKVKHKLLFEFVSGSENHISLGKALDEIFILGSSEELESLENWFIKSTKVDFYNPTIRVLLKEKLLNITTNKSVSKTSTSDLSDILPKEITTTISVFKERYNSTFSNFKDITSGIYIQKKHKIILISFFSLIFISILTFNIVKKVTYSEYELDFYTLSSIVQIDYEKHHKMLADIISSDMNSDSFGIPKYFEYRDVNIENLVLFLNSRNSLLTDKEYYKIIIDISKSNNINPILLFAIIGQEQGFVDRSNPNSQDIINNPFNVYTSWLDYNTHIEDSTQIAANTIVLRLKNRPRGIDPFLWINETYAEDNRWWIGVKSLYYTLESKIGY